MKYSELPTWDQCKEILEAHERHPEGAPELTPLEKFIYDGEPIGETESWRADLLAALNEVLEDRRLRTCKPIHVTAPKIHLYCILVFTFLRTVVRSF